MMDVGVAVHKKNIPRLPAFHIYSKLQYYLLYVTIYLMGKLIVYISCTCLLHDLFLYSVIISTVLKLWQTHRIVNSFYYLVYIQAIVHFNMMLICIHINIMLKCTCIYIHCKKYLCTCKYTVIACSQESDLCMYM